MGDEGRAEFSRYRRDSLGLASQADLFARARADVGISRAGDHADAVTDGWILRAAAAIRAHAAGCRDFLIEDVVANHPEPPPDGRAWGAATRFAQRKGWIFRVGYAPANTSNRSPKCLWRRTQGG